MIWIFSGDDRVRISVEVKKMLGEGYEVFEGGELTLNDLPSLFFGASLLFEKRKILIKDFSENKEAFDKIVDYLETEHEVVVWETKLDKRTATYKELKKKGILLQEFKAPEKTNTTIVFNIFDTAFRDGKRAVKMLEQIENEQDPYMFFGLLTTQALKKFEMRQGEKEKRVLRELSKLDKKMKTTSIQPWTLVKSFLLQVSSL